MKKLALVFASLCLAATPVLACPHSDSAKDEAPRTAEKAKPSKDAKAKTVKAKNNKSTKDKVAKPQPKKGAKVSKR